MKKKIIFAVIIIAIVALITVIFLMMKKSYNYNSDKHIKEKGYEIFGSDYCSRKGFGDKEHPLLAGDTISPYTCMLCEKRYNHSNTATPKICSSCATITGRCDDCGKLKRNNL